MALSDILELSSDKQKKKIGISEERLEAIKPYIRQYIAYWREYPDMSIIIREYFCAFVCDINMYMQFFLVHIQSLSYQYQF